MLANGLRFFTDIPLTVLGLLLFVAVFAVTSGWVLFRSGARAFYGKIAEYPLSEGDRHE